MYEDKVWGRVAHVCASRGVAIDYLEVKGGYQSSRHYHLHKSNTFFVVDGAVIVVEWASLNPDAMPTCSTLLTAGQTHVVKANVDHRFCVIEPSVIIEHYTAAKEGQRVRLGDIIRRDEGGKIPDPKMVGLI